MAQGGGIQLAVNVGTVADQSDVVLNAGGRYVIAADATTYSTTCQVQVKLMNGSYANVGSNLTANGLSSGLDLPAGIYRLHMTGGTAAALFVSLLRIPY